MAKKAIVVTAAVILLMVGYHRINTCECKKRISYRDIHINDPVDREKLFVPVTREELESTFAAWKTFRHQSDHVQMIKSFNYSLDRPLQIWEHTSNGQKHYGVVILPTNYRPNSNYPVLLWANGLDQKNPQR